MSNRLNASHLVFPAATIACAQRFAPHMPSLGDHKVKLVQWILDWIADAADLDEEVLSGELGPQLAKAFLAEFPAYGVEF